MSALTASLPIAMTHASQAVLEQLDEINKIILSYPQIELVTEHLFHGGMYARTIRLEPKTKMMGSLIKLATILIVHGDCSVLIGEQRVELTGYNVIPGCAGRKQLFCTHGPVEMTMIYPTSLATVEEAEDEVFYESDQLMSRRDGSGDIIIVTGE